MAAHIMSHNFQAPSLVPKRLKEQGLLPQRQESKGRRFLVIKGHDKGHLQVVFFGPKKPPGEAWWKHLAAFSQGRENGWEWMRMDANGRFWASKMLRPLSSSQGFMNPGLFFVHHHAKHHKNSSEITCHKFVEIHGLMGARAIFSPSAAQGITRTSRHPVRLSLPTLKHLR